MNLINGVIKAKIALALLTLFQQKYCSQKTHNRYLFADPIHGINAYLCLIQLNEKENRAIRCLVPRDEKSKRTILCLVQQDKKACNAFLCLDQLDEKSKRTILFSNKQNEMACKVPLCPDQQNENKIGLFFVLFRQTGKQSDFFICLPK
jgi:hypothetical protein